MIRTLLLGVAVGIAAAGGTSAQTKRTAAVYGAGMVSCGKWQQYRTTGDKASSFQLQAWIDGFLSGYNAASTGPDFLVGKPDNTAIYIWIDNYCRDKPLDAVVRAVFALKDELAARTR